MTRIGIDIGSTASKVCVIGEDDRPRFEVLPTGWNSKITAGIIKENLEKLGVDLESAKIVATGYGRISVDYADKVITEITCHGRGGYEMAGQEDCSIIDVGGQDTKYILVQDGRAVDFLMNDSVPLERASSSKLWQIVLGLQSKNYSRRLNVVIRYRLAQYARFSQNLRLSTTWVKVARRKKLQLV